MSFTRGCTSERYIDYGANSTRKRPCETARWNTRQVMCEQITVKTVLMDDSDFNSGGRTTGNKTNANAAWMSEWDATTVTLGKVNPCKVHPLWKNRETDKHTLGPSVSQPLCHLPCKALCENTAFSPKFLWGVVAVYIILNPHNASGRRKFWDSWKTTVDSFTMV